MRPPIAEGGDTEVDFAARYILDELDIEIEEPETPFLDEILARFDGRFPTTVEFSLAARTSLKNKISPVEDADHAL